MSQLINQVPTRCPRTMHSLMASIALATPGTSLVPPPVSAPDARPVSR